MEQVSYLRIDAVRGMFIAFLPVFDLTFNSFSMQLIASHLPSPFNPFPYSLLSHKLLNPFNTEVNTVVKMSITDILIKKDLKALYQRITKIVSSNSNIYSFYDVATLVDDYLHYSPMCKESIDNKVFTYRCSDGKCEFTVIVDYNSKEINVSELTCK